MSQKQQTLAEEEKFELEAVSGRERSGSPLTKSRAGRGTSPNTWRRRRDSNPRGPFEPNGFQDRRLQPLGHSSVSNSNALYSLQSDL